MKILHYSTKDGINWNMISNKKTPLIYLKYQIFMIQLSKHSKILYRYDILHNFDKMQFYDNP